MLPAPSVKTKLAVHWAPSVYIWTPGWIWAVAAGAQAAGDVLAALGGDGGAALMSAAASDGGA